MKNLIRLSCFSLLLSFMPGCSRENPENYRRRTRIGQLRLLLRHHNRKRSEKSRSCTSAGPPSRSARKDEPGAAVKTHAALSFIRFQSRRTVHPGNLRQFRKRCHRGSAGKRRSSSTCSSGGNANDPGRYLADSDDV